MYTPQWSRAAVLAIAVLLTPWAPGRAPAAAHDHVSAPHGVPNVQATHDRYPDHAEPALAANPRDPRNLLGAAMYFTGSPTPGTFASFDGGYTWHDNGALPRPAGFGQGGDVSVAFDARGHGFVAAETATAKSADRGVYVWRTDDGGRHFGRPVAVVSGEFVDHPCLAVAASGPGAGDLYVVWVTRRGSGSSQMEGLAFSRSVDGGRRFSPPRLIAGPPGGITAPVAAAGPGGSVYAAFVTVVSGRVLSGGQASAGGVPALAVEVVASADRGRTFGPPRVVGPTVFGLTPQPGLIVPTGPSLVVDPRDGAVEVAYTAGRDGTARAGIVLARSLDRGRTWQAPVQIAAASSSNRAVYFQPRVAVDSVGRLAVSYLSLARGRVAVLLSQSAAPGVRFGSRFRPARPITDRPFDPSLGLPGDKEGLWWIGDYQGLAMGAGLVYPCWGDTRSGHLQIFTAAVAAT